MEWSVKEPCRNYQKEFGQRTKCRLYCLLWPYLKSVVLTLAELARWRSRELQNNYSFDNTLWCLLCETVAAELTIMQYQANIISASGHEHLVIPFNEHVPFLLLGGNNRVYFLFPFFPPSDYWEDGGHISHSSLITSPDLWGSRECILLRLSFPPLLTS